MSFYDRLTQFPGRVKLTDTTTGDEQIVDVERAEGDITDEGTTLDSDGFDTALESYFDIGQYNADLIASDLSSSGVSIPSGVSGSVKYGKIGSLVVVYVKLTVTTAIDGYKAIAGGIPSAYRPTADKLESLRISDREKARLGTDGIISVDGNYPIGTQLFCEFCWYV